MKKKLAIIGCGSAGIQSVSHFLTWLKEDWTVTIFYDESIAITGIGESTNPVFVNNLQLGTDFNLQSDLASLNGTLKFATEYIDWRDKSFFNPFMAGNIGIHMDTHKLKDFAIDRFKTYWGKRFKEVIGNVTEIINEKNYAAVMLGDKKYVFDYVIDCTGFPKSYEKDYHVFEGYPTNHALVHNVERDLDNIFNAYNTEHIATDNGWMFTVPLKNRMSYGYLFNDQIVNIETAKEDFANRLNISKDDLNNIEYKFKAYYCNKIVNNRVMANGNKAFFIEPLFGNSLFVYDQANRVIYDYIMGRITQESANKVFTQTAEDVHDVICYHYHGGSKYNTDFWQNAIGYSKDHLKQSKRFGEIPKTMKHANINNVYDDTILWIFNSPSLNTLDKNFNYNYFN